MYDDSEIKYLRYRAKTSEMTPQKRSNYENAKDDLAFHELPPGNWTIGELIRDSTTQKLTLGALLSEKLESLDSWHSIQIDIGELDPYRMLVVDLDEAQMHPDYDCLPIGRYAASKVDFKNGNHPQFTMMHSAFCKPGLGSDLPLVCHHEWLPDMMGEVKDNFEMLGIVDGHEISPRVLAQVTENNHQRIVGYVLEAIPHARMPVKGDLSACQAVLQRLHDLGWAFRPETHWESVFVLDEYNTAYIQLFLEVDQVEDPKDFAKSMASLQAWFDGLDPVRGFVWKLITPQNVPDSADHLDA